ncbi:hypothetical protein KRE40_07825 [Elizabethkingia meningoseptica]|uniref:hypothetical protein n=1 Tax=Elizabethkingia meningoseptica TaxID=238 RepID=UPI00099A3390|nr:hypothetical protein [Elizabethkingia meningoseptica]MDE5438014.1 hypothetical protein [Elizabethkingia meningoseptica]MDE5492140.1 hypothetical protein [Elizabethkingia meningoseptica]MDE5508557.1 hypothetical protein [Elizabethkingia meningoseptica]MDE5516083.1 hypothetical protein [Elizabethkingia meningoseptica]MDE5526940.1 hypothetical protein [Elizabethkingia meningoseptica]
MDYKEISEKLEDSGYATQFHNLINSLTVGIPENENFKLDSIFRIEKSGDRMIVNYFIGQVPVEKEFKTVEELLKFVRQVFPIEE